MRCILEAEQLSCLVLLARCAGLAKWRSVFERPEVNEQLHGAAGRADRLTARRSTLARSANQQLASVALKQTCGLPKQHWSQFVLLVMNEAEQCSKLTAYPTTHVVAEAQMLFNNLLSDTIL